MKTLIITAGILMMGFNAKADTTLTYKTGNERHLVVYKSCDGIYWEVHKMVTVKPNEVVKLRLKDIKGYEFKVEKHIYKL